MAVNSGKYRHRIKIYKSSGERDSLGADTGAKTLVAHPWCSALPLADVESAGATTTGQYMIEFETRYSKSLINPTSAMTLEFKNIEYDIVTVINILELNEKLKIVAKTR